MDCSWRAASDCLRWIFETLGRLSASIFFASSFWREFLPLRRCWSIDSHPCRVFVGCRRAPSNLDSIIQVCAVRVLSPAWISISRSFSSPLFPHYRSLKSTVRGSRASALTSPTAPTQPPPPTTAPSSHPRARRPFSNWISPYETCKSERLSIYAMVANDFINVSFRFQDHIPPEEMSLSHQMAALNCHDCFRVVLEHWLVIARSKVTLLPLSHKSSWCVPYLSPSPSLTRTVSLPRHVRLIEQFLAFLIQALNRVRSAVELDSFTNVEPYLKHSTSAIDTTSCFYQVGVLRQRQRERESFKLQIKGDSLSLCTGRLRTVRP